MKSMLFALLLASSVLAQDKPKAIKESFDFGLANKWNHEQIPLPPSFAPKMTWKGVEEIRFAPGMFSADAEDFFSYVIIFSVPGKESFTEKELRREFLAYYQGLSEAVSKSQGKKVDTTMFTIDLKKGKSAGAPESVVKAKNSITAYSGTLKWIEPFATGKPQTLNLELHAWQDAKKEHRYLFACVSPQATGHELWNTLRKIRKSFAAR